MRLDVDIQIYGELQPYNEVCSIARCRIFYLGLNRNGTFITESFANELLASLPYTPIKGIYDSEIQDYTDHGEQRSEGRIYGIVPAESNVQWEMHTDADNVVRRYACCDVILYTALYEEVRGILHKGQSMELYGPTLTYHIERLGGQSCIVFDHGSFLGLQILGQHIEPCFEGAEFYTLFPKIENYIKIKGSEFNMQFNYCGANADMRFNLTSILNKDINTDNENFVFQKLPIMIEETSALIYDCADNKFQRVNFENQEDHLTINEITDVEMEQVNAAEKEMVSALYELNDNNHEEINEYLKQAKENFSQVSQIAELQNQISTYSREKDEAIVEVENLRQSLENEKSQYALLEQECEELKVFKLNIETEQKNGVIDSYAAVLSADKLNEYRDKINDYTVKSLDQALAYELKQTNPSILTPNKPEGSLLKKEEPLSGIEAILSKYM